EPGGRKPPGSYASECDFYLARMPPQKVRAEPFRKLTPTTQMPVRLPGRIVPGSCELTVVLILHLPLATVQYASAKSFRLMTVQGWPPQSSAVARTEAARQSTCPLQLGSRFTSCA